MELIFLPGRIGLPAGSHPWTATWVTGLKSSGFTMGFGLPKASVASSQRFQESFWRELSALRVWRFAAFKGDWAYLLSGRRAGVGIEQSVSQALHPDTVAKMESLPSFGHFDLEDLHPGSCVFYPNRHFQPSKKLMRLKCGHSIFPPSGLQFLL